MFHLFSVFWDVLWHHRHHWLVVVAGVAFLGLGGYGSLTMLNAQVARQYERNVVSQQPTQREQILQRRLRRRAMRAERLAVAHPSAPIPPFGNAVYPVDKVPDWGIMRTPAEWTRTYAQMTAGDFVPLPPYDLDVLTLPMAGLIAPYRPENIPAITAKLVYSTRFFGSYDVDSGEFTGAHSGVDIKLALGTPVGAIGGGRVVQVGVSDNLGIFVMVEHRLQTEGTAYSTYGHLAATSVAVGQDVEPGQTLGTVGMTGKTTGPHLHLQVDRGTAGAKHVPYHPEAPPTREEALARALHPIELIEKYKGASVAGTSSPTL